MVFFFYEFTLVSKMFAVRPTASRSREINFEISHIFSCFRFVETKTLWYGLVDLFATFRGFNEFQQNWLVLQKYINKVYVYE